MRRTMAAMCIYARYFSFIFLVLLMLASIFVDFSRLNEVPHLEEANFRVYQSRFLLFKAKAVCITADVLIDEAWISLLFFLC